MTPTETLRAMLDERGVTHFDRYDVTEWVADDGEICHTSEINSNGASVMVLRKCTTPAQAIAATLGRWTLSASQVSNAVYAHSIHADCADADWQAIADELNNMLDSSNCTNSERMNAACKPITYDNGYSIDRLEPGEYHEFWEPACACGNCGELIPMRKFCPNCGCRLEVEA